MVKGDILDSICVAFHCLLKVSCLVVPYLKEQPTGTWDTINEPFATGYEEPWYTLCVFTQASVHAKQDRGQCYHSSNFRFSKRVLIRFMLLKQSCKNSLTIGYGKADRGSPVSLDSCNPPWLWHLLRMTVPNWNQIQSITEWGAENADSSPAFIQKVKVGVVRGKRRKPKKYRAQGTYM